MIDYGHKRMGWNPAGWICPDCGSLVLDRQKHSRFHEDLDMDRLDEKVAQAKAILRRAAG